MGVALRVIQAGIGGFGQWWLQVLLKDRLVKVVGVVDTDGASLAKARELGVEPELCFRNMRAALGSVEADAVVDVTPPSAHVSISKAVMEAGLSVLVEKPMALTLRKAATMARLADEHGVTLMVSQNYRFSEGARAMRSLIHKGKVGRPEQVNVLFRKAPRFAGFRARMPDPLIVDMSIHHFDLIRAITGTDAVRVSGRSRRHSWSWVDGHASAAVVFEMSDGSVVCYDGSWISRGPVTSWDGDWRFEGDKGCLVWRKEKVRLFGPDDNRGTALEIPKRKRVGQEATLAEFVDAVRKGREPECSGRDNLNSLAMVECAVKACRSGRSVDIEAALRRAVG